ncbi:MAG: hypothetical protein BAJALOKI2v1_490016 [Promethearchaeota archaeon]|nr:MAG: hypothetical protein BAJALOKI2v1_490016 [Candidatus Lokiarchaeota archaeon]
MKDEINKKHVLIIFILLFSIGFYFIELTLHHRPNYYLITESYDEKMEEFGFEIPIFIKQNTEKNSSIMIFDKGIYDVAKPILYPERDVFLRRTYEDEDALFSFIQKNSIDYMLIYFDSGPTHLINNNTFFSPIKYSPEIYLLKINREVFLHL